MLNLWLYHWIALGLVLSAIVVLLATFGAHLTRDMNGVLMGLWFVAAVLGLVAIELVYRIKRLFIGWRGRLGYNG